MILYLLFQNVDELKGIEDSLLYETLRVLIMAMKISGIFFVKKKGSFGNSLKERLRSLTALQASIRTKLENQKSSWRNNVSLYHAPTELNEMLHLEMCLIQLRFLIPFQVYCIVNIVILFLNFIRSFFAFKAGETFGSLLFFKLLTSIFAYEAMSRAMLGYWGCFKKKLGKIKSRTSLHISCSSEQKIQIANTTQHDQQQEVPLKQSIPQEKMQKHTQKHTCVLFDFSVGIPYIFLSIEKICFSDGIIPYESSLKTTMHTLLATTVAISGFNVGLTAYGLFGPDFQKYDAYTGRSEQHNLPCVLVCLACHCWSPELLSSQQKFSVENIPCLFLFDSSPNSGNITWF